MTDAVTGWAEGVLGEMTLSEKASMVGGSGVWRTTGVPRLGVPALDVSDGPNGVRGSSFTAGSSACFPCGTALAATWDPELVREVATALGQEARAKGVRLLLAPTLNIHRSPLAGRNFECYSEDPHLSARMAVAYIEGVQAQGVGTTAKHFVCNDSEFERMSISSEVGERALREIYLPPFEAAVREAGSWSVMAAYNKVNGTFASEHTELLRDLLKDEWGFEGFVISDWFGTRSTLAAARAGLDLEMPGPPIWMGERLLAAVRDGEVEEPVLDDKVRRLLAWVARSRVADGPSDEKHGIDHPAHRRVARRAAAEAIVLLKNDRGVLPLRTADIRTLAVIGPNADRAQVQGGGSAEVNPHYSVTPLEGIRARCGEAVSVAFEPGCTIDRGTPQLDVRHLDGGWRLEYFDNLEVGGEPVLTETATRSRLVWLGSFSPRLEPGMFSVRCRSTFTPTVTGSHILSLTSAGKSRLLANGHLTVDNWTAQTRGSAFFGFGSTEVTGELELTEGVPVGVEIQYAVREGAPLGGLAVGCRPPLPGADVLMERAAALANRVDAVVVVVGTSTEWETEGADRVSMDLPGRQPELIARVAAANPNTVVAVNTGSPVTMDWADGVPALLQLWFPGQEGGNALADVLFGDISPSGKLPTTFPVRLEDNPAFLSYPGENGSVLYGEGIFVGYRYYDRKRVAPRFCFGHGLSYTSFAYGQLVLDVPEVGPDDEIGLSVEVSNTGPRAGQEVVQLYIRDIESRLVRPDKELKAFAKISLEAGETRSVRFRLGQCDLSYWDPGRHGWVAEAGEFQALVGSSSADIRAAASFVLRAGGA